MTIQQCEFTGNRCVKDTCDNCGIYAIHCLSCNITEATEKVGNEFIKLASKTTKVIEEVYDRYYDTDGNLHWKGTQTGEHMINDSETIKEDWEGKFFMMKKTAEWLAEKAPKWISTTEKKPSPNERVLVYHSGYGITVGFMHTWGEWDIKQAYPENPTHWMPLPDPPNEGN